MELHQLREFATIAESRSFSGAARQLHLAQPPLSRHIRHLEEELGVKLFVRTATGVQLTPEGIALLEQARIVLADTDTFLDLAQRVRVGRAKALRVAMAPGFCEVVNRIRVHLVGRAAALSIEGADMSSAAQHAALRRRTIDVGLLREVPDDPEIASASLFAERFVVMISETNPLAKRRSLRIRQLAAQRVMLQDRDWAALAYSRILALYAAAGLTPTIVTYESAPGNQASMLAIASGEAICFGLQGPISRSYLPVSGVAIVPLDEPDARHDVQVAWRQSDASPALCEFLGAARRLFSRASA